MKRDEAGNGAAREAVYYEGGEPWCPDNGQLVTDAGEILAVFHPSCFGGDYMFRPEVLAALRQLLADVGGAK